MNLNKIIIGIIMGLLSILAILILCVLAIEKMSITSIIVLCIILSIAPITYFNEVYKEIKA